MRAKEEFTIGSVWEYVVNHQHLIFLVISAPTWDEEYQAQDVKYMTLVNNLFGWEPGVCDSFNDRGQYWHDSVKLA